MNQQPGLMMLGDGKGCLYFNGSWLKQSVASFMILTAFKMPPNRDPMAEVKKAVRGFHAPSGTLLFWSLDAVVNSLGLLKQPDGHCRHLSLSFHETDLDMGLECGRIRQVGPKDNKLTERWLDCFFGADKERLWCEPPVTAHGRKFDVWHYRLFCDENWQPLRSRGELYSSRELVAPGWKSWSDVNEERRRQPAAETETTG